MESKEEGDLLASVSNALTHYNSIKGKNVSEIPHKMWDIVVLTASDADQKMAYEEQIKTKIKQRDVPLGVEYKVFADPPGPKVGCGGSTIYVIDSLHKEYGDKLWSLHVMLINAGGMSQRLPTASALGKLFTILPIGDIPTSIFDLKMALFLPFLRKMKPGFFLPASDTIEIFDIGSRGKWTFEKPGFTAPAHPSSLEIGVKHGVFVLDPEERSTGATAEVRTCLEVLQKPSIEMMRKKKAIIKNGTTNLASEMVYTDSCFFFDHEVSRKFLNFHAEKGPVECEINSYGDFLQPLGPKATSDYINDVKNVSFYQPGLVEMRQNVFDLLQGIPLNVILLNCSKFYHFGTTTEYLQHFNAQTSLAKEIGFKNHVFNYFGNEFTQSCSKKKKIDFSDTLQGCFMHNYIACAAQSVSTSPSVVEYCDISVPVDIGENSILSNCCYALDLEAVDSNNDDEELDGVANIAVSKIPKNCLFHTVAIQWEGKPKYCTIVLDILDNVKNKVDSVENAHQLKFLGRKLSESSLHYGPYCNLFMGSSDIYGLWQAKLFPIAETMSRSFSHALEMVRSSRTNKVKDMTLPGIELLSCADIMKVKDVNTMIEYRKNLFAKIKESSDMFNDNGI